MTLQCSGCQHCDWVILGSASCHPETLGAKKPLSLLGCDYQWSSVFLTKFYRNSSPKNYHLLTLMLSQTCMISLLGSRLFWTPLTFFVWTVLQKAAATQQPSIKYCHILTYFCRPTQKLASPWFPQKKSNQIFFNSFGLLQKKALWPTKVYSSYLFCSSG